MPSVRRPVAIAALIALGSLMAACGATPTSTALPSGASTPVTTATSAAERTPMPSPSPTPFPFAAIDGMKCAGTWTNPTLGSSGPITITFDLRRSAAVVLDVGGRALGSNGGHIVLPVTLAGSTFHIGGSFGFLGTLNVAVDADGTASAVLDQPPSLGSGFRVTVTKFTLSGGRLSIESLTTVNGAAIATSTVDAGCTSAS